MNNNFYNQQNDAFYQSAEGQQYMRNMMMKKQIEYAKKQQRKELVKVSFVLGGAIVLYLFLQTMWSVVLSVSGLYDIYQNSTMFKYAFNVIGVDLLSMLPSFVIAALILKKNFVSDPIPTKKVGGLKAAAWVFFGVGMSLIANYIVAIMIEFVKNVLGYKLTQNDYGSSNSVLTFIMMFIGVAVAPAVFEEIAFRCCALGVLRKYGKSFAVFTVSVIFGLIHGNVIQFVFAFLAGVVLAYITIKTDNVIIVMFVHFINNGRSVINDIVQTAVNKQTATTVTAIVMIVLIVLAIVSFVYLIITKSFKGEKKAKSVYDNNYATKLACMIPGLIVPFAILIKLTSQYVTKI